MDKTNSADPLQLEQDAFDAALNQLLPEHEGEFVVFKDKKPSGFFPSFRAAYESALQRFGLDSAFLVAPVCAPGHDSQIPCDAVITAATVDLGVPTIRKWSRLPSRSARPPHRTSHPTPLA